VARTIELSEEAVLVLASLIGGPKHGYALIADVEEHPGKRLGPGTLYSSIRALLEEGLIEEVDHPRDPSVTDERRRYYHLTSAGRRLARSEAERLADLLRVARSKHILRGDYV